MNAADPPFGDPLLYGCNLLRSMFANKLKNHHYDQMMVLPISIYSYFVTVAAISR